MTLNKPIIIWEKWVDPFGKDIDEAKWTDYNNSITDLSDIVSLDDSLNENNHQNYPPETIHNPIKVIASPLGLIPYNEHTASSKIFNFWLGHTNFSITESIKNMIEKSEGIEILDVFTRYRFRIAIGKCFVDSDVMSAINEKVKEIMS